MAKGKSKTLSKETTRKDSPSTKKQAPSPNSKRAAKAQKEAGLSVQEHQPSLPSPVRSVEGKSLQGGGRKRQRTLSSSYNSSDADDTETCSSSSTSGSTTETTDDTTTSFASSDEEDETQLGSTTGTTCSSIEGDGIMESSEGLAAATVGSGGRAQQWFLALRGLGSVQSDSLISVPPFQHVDPSPLVQMAGSTDDYTTTQRRKIAEMCAPLYCSPSEYTYRCLTDEQRVLFQLVEDGNSFYELLERVSAPGGPHISFDEAIDKTVLKREAAPQQQRAAAEVRSTTITHHERDGKALQKAVMDYLQSDTTADPKEPAAQKIPAEVSSSRPTKLAGKAVRARGAVPASAAAALDKQGTGGSAIKEGKRTGERKKRKGVTSEDVAVRPTSGLLQASRQQWEKVKVTDAELQKDLEAPTAGGGALTSVHGALEREMFSRKVDERLYRQEQKHQKEKSEREQRKRILEENNRM